MVALGDVHLTRATPHVVAEDLARFVEMHPGARIVIAGDLFDLSADLPKLPLDRAIEEVFSTHSQVKAALGRHIIQGGELWLVSGNHDAGLGFDDFRNALVRAFDLPTEARSRLRTTPWFFREGDLHIEHGHLFDPDNAPAHPLVLGEASLGVHFVEQFIAPTGAYRYLNMNDETPLKLLLSAFSFYGPRAPYVIYRYFHAAIQAIVRSGPAFRRRTKMEEPLGEEEISRFTEALGVSPELARTLLDLSARPTLESVSRTFSRLYFDRVLSTIAMGAGLSAVALGKKRAGQTVFSIGALAMASSWARGHNRYRGSTAEQLADGAQRIVDTTGAKLVIFGHTHREALGENYANTASFAFPRGAPGRPFLEINAARENPRAHRRYWPMSA
jgi:UDP-2,3-diacylglucosamine pyrophosphatase LpxH